MVKANSNIIPLLREVEIFSEFDDKILNEFAQNMEEVYLRKGDTLFKKGDQESAMYIILDGSVQVHDNEYIFTTLNTKQFFGEYSLIDSAVRSASVTAVRDSHLLELQQKTFNLVTKQKPEIWKSVLVALIKRLRDYNILEEKLTMRTIDIQKKKYEIEREKESIESQKKELEAINSTKDKFFTIIAHDLKNPFSTVISISDMLLSRFQKYNEEQALEYISQISKFSKNAFNLLENLLQWARSQTGSLKINFKRTNIYSIIEDVLQLFEGNAKQKNLSFETQMDKKLHGYIDVDMITTVIRNLVSNAIKYSNHNGKIYLSAEESADMLTISVTDEGVGLSDDNFENLFRIDARQSTNGTVDEEGTGLGLILCKEFVMKNGGEIWAERNKERGLTFKFTLPKAL